MGRLVDIEDVKEFINGLDSLPWEEELDDLVNTIPTAYDAEKVEIEIRHCSGKGYRDIDGDYVPPMIETDTVIGLVRRGGVK